MSDRTARVIVLALLSPFALATSLASEPAPARAPTPDAGPAVVATLKELMDSTVDPAADGIWDAVAISATKRGIEHRQPRTAKEWAALRRDAVTLAEVMNLVALPGRHAAPAGTNPGLGELAPAQIDSAIAEQRALFVAFAKALQSTAVRTLEAIDRKDADAVMRIGGDIDAACEACHVTFWYPPPR